MLSVIICTHNPRVEYLDRTLIGLRNQSLSPDAWELIIVDNASSPPVSDKALPDWHPNARVVLESEQGVAPARLRGIAEARGDILVFVDDDNVLSHDYLERGLSLSRQFAGLGAWGCGRFLPEWEETPSEALYPYLRYLAVHSAEMDHRSCKAYDYPAMPVTAGLCVRSNVVRRYAEIVRDDPRRKLLGRNGKDLSGCEDFDIDLTAIDLGMETGVFVELSLTHLIPRERLETDYLLRIVEGHARSTVLLMALRGDSPGLPVRGVIGRLREYRLRRRLEKTERSIHDARRRGEEAAWKVLSNVSMQHSGRQV